MYFSVKLIDVLSTRNSTARNDLQRNCTHVAGTYWLFEGDEEALDAGVRFTIVGEEAIEAHGDLTGDQIVKMVSEVYNVDKCFLK